MIKMSELKHDVRNITSSGFLIENVNFLKRTRTTVYNNIAINPFFFALNFGQMANRNRVGSEIVRLSRMRHYCNLMVAPASAVVYHATLRVATRTLAVPSPISSVCACKSNGLWSNNSALYDAHHPLMPRPDRPTDVLPLKPNNAKRRDAYVAQTSSSRSRPRPLLA